MTPHYVTKYIAHPFIHLLFGNGNSKHCGQLEDDEKSLCFWQEHLF